AIFAGAGRGRIRPAVAHRHDVHVRKGLEAGDVAGPGVIARPDQTDAQWICCHTMLASLSVLGANTGPLPVARRNQSLPFLLSGETPESNGPRPKRGCLPAIPFQGSDDGFH